MHMRRLLLTATVAGAAATGAVAASQLTGTAARPATTPPVAHVSAARHVSAAPRCRLGVQAPIEGGGAPGQVVGTATVRCRVRTRNVTLGALLQEQHQGVWVPVGGRRNTWQTVRANRTYTASGQQACHSAPFRTVATLQVGGRTVGQRVSPVADITCA